MLNEEINKRKLICQAGDILTILNAMGELIDSSQELGEKFMMGSLIETDVVNHLDTIRRACKTIHAISADIRHHNFPNEDGTTETNT